MTPDIRPSATGLVVFDLLECYRDSVEESGALELVVALMAGCRREGIPIFYARADHRPDGADLAQAPTDTDRWLRPWDDHNRPATRPTKNAAGSPGTRVLSEIAPQPGDYDIPKHRWSAFFQTPLELSLRTRGIDTVLIVGGSTHVGVASTVYAGRDMDFDMVVVSDCLTGFAEQRTFFVTKVFPRMCRVRTSQQVLSAIGGV